MKYGRYPPVDTRSRQFIRLPSASDPWIPVRIEHHVTPLTPRQTRINAPFRSRHFTFYASPFRTLAGKKLGIREIGSPERICTHAIVPAISLPSLRTRTISALMRVTRCIFRGIDISFNEEEKNRFERRFQSLRKVFFGNFKLFYTRDEWWGERGRSTF